MQIQNVINLLKGKNIAFLATLMPDKSPQVTPVWIDTDGTHVLINTATNRIKYKNITRDPRVAVSVVDASNPYNMVSIRGIVEDIIRGKEADDHIDALAKRYLGVDRYPFRREGEERVIIRIKPKSIFVLV
jgi:PPOX class probable F420-dependent enzyme